MNRRTFLQIGTGSALAVPLGAHAGDGGSSPKPSAPQAEWARVFRDRPETEHAAVRSRNRELRASDQRPNILFVFTDQQSAEAMSCAGNPWVRTPFIDSLARRGVRFSRSYCSAPICTPARASLFTGRTAHETKADYLTQTPDPALPNLGQVLQRAGYETTYIGKWHLPESYVKTEDGIPGFHNLPIPEGILGGNLGDATDMHFAMRAGYYLRWHAGLSAKPWFLSVSLHNPHDICHYCMPGNQIVNMPEPDPATIQADRLPPLPANFAADPDEPELLIERRGQSKYAVEMGVKGEWTEAQWRAYLHTYFHMTQSVDRCLQPILAGLEAGGWTDNTLVIFTSDHGEGMAAHEWVTKLSLYEEVVRVPMILIPPGGWNAPRHRHDGAHLVSGLDVMPTVLDYAGVRDLPTLRGNSLRPLVEGGEAAGWREHLVTEIALDPKTADAHGRMVVSADGWKYCLWSKGERHEQLFDLNSDSGETKNVATFPENADRISRLRAALADYAKATGDTFTLA